MEVEAVGTSQLAAWVMLAVYLAVAAVILPHEVNWLKSVEQPFKNRFITLDALFQLFILMVLLPPALVLLNSLSGFIILGIGFIGLWIVVIWTAIARYRYVHRFLAQQQELLKQEFTKLEQEISKEDQASE